MATKCIWFFGTLYGHNFMPTLTGLASLLIIEQTLGTVFIKTEIVFSRNGDTK